jgi:hypothetical protein
MSAHAKKLSAFLTHATTVSASFRQGIRIVSSILSVRIWCGSMLVLTMRLALAATGAINAIRVITVSRYQKMSFSNKFR